jgi:hypothetical protein
MYSIFSISTCFLKLPSSLRVSIKLFFKIAFTALSILLKLWDEFYLQLLENERLPYLNKRKKENIKSKKFNEWIFSNERFFKIL